MPRIRNTGRTLADNRKRYAENDELREQMLATMRLRYAEDP
jgi:hypothetical protein